MSKTGVGKKYGRWNRMRNKSIVKERINEREN